MVDDDEPAGHDDSAYDAAELERDERPHPRRHDPQGGAPEHVPVAVLELRLKDAQDGE